MGVKKEISIDGKMVAFKVSAAIPRMYRLKFRSDIFSDMSKLDSSVQGSKEEASTIPLESLEIFENIAYIMAKHADPQNVSNDVNEWLEQFGTLSIYQVLPDLIQLWGVNVETQVDAKKNKEVQPES